MAKGPGTSGSNERWRRRKAEGAAKTAAVVDRLSEEGEPWDRKMGESQRAYEAFVVYRDMGDSRTLEGVREEMSRRHGEEDGSSGKRGAKGVRGQTIWLWRKENGWDERAWAWDQWCERERRKGIAKALRARATEEEERRLKARARHEDETLMLSQQLKLKALKMLQWGLEEVVEEVEEVDKLGNVVKVVRRIAPAKWTMRDAPLLARTAWEMERSVLVPKAEREASADGEVPVGPGEASAEEMPDVLRGAAARLGAWREEQRRARIRMPRLESGPPRPEDLKLASGGDGASVPASGNGHSGNGNGNGNGHG